MKLNEFISLPSYPFSVLFSPISSTQTLSLTPRLIWFLWRQACRVEPSDPESVITELEAACTESHLAHQEGAVSTVRFVVREFYA